MRKPIHFAATNSNPEVLKILLDNGIDCRDVDMWKMTPLMYAA